MDWSGGEHWSPNPRPCRYCSRTTNLRDDDGLPTHKTCAENQHSADRGIPLR
ncbi:hypothetical protein [Streptomyces sp. NBC_01497]|uniref:hypothetical protein n=1 Tax=Streptomyces sp. NBC_01497 TaxID=2903885 RepID=UPI002E371628|nr:hypothetical protein [Streptomyces sp. NBC_01497]